MRSERERDSSKFLIKFKIFIRSHNILLEEKESKTQMNYDVFQIHMQIHCIQLV